MLNNWKQTLKSIGFNDSEANIYLVGLELGPATAADIAKRADVSRVTAYTAIDRLTEYGLMSSVEKGRGTLFQAEPPEHLIGYVESRIKEMQQTMNSMSSNIEELKMLERADRPVVKMFEGPNALHAIESDILELQPKQIDEFFNRDDLYKLYPPPYRDAFIQEIGKMSPKVRSIALTSNINITSSKNKEVTIVALSPQDYNFSGDVLVYEDRVALTSFKGKQMSVIIQSKAIAETVRSFFDFALKKKSSE